MIKFSTLCVSILIFSNSFGQPKYSLTFEKIEKKSTDLLSLLADRLNFVAGHNDSVLVYQLNEKASHSTGNALEAVLKVYYNEQSKKVLDSIAVKNKHQRIHKFNQRNGLKLFRGYFALPPQLTSSTFRELSIEPLSDYQDFWVQNEKSQQRLKTYKYNFYDRDVDYFIDAQGKFITLTPFVAEYLRSTVADSIISIWNLATKQSNAPEKELACIECIRPQIVGNYIYYSKQFYPIYGADVTDWKFYRAPLFDLSKSEMLGDYFLLLLISPDGKYALGKKSLMRRQTLAIINLETKRLQYLMGRDYEKFKFFYSPGYQKFAFDRPKHILYIDYPTEFPFNALGPEAKPKDASIKDSDDFWAQYVLPAFE